MAKKDETQQEQTQQEQTEQKQQGPKMVTVMLHKDNNENRDDLFVGVNMKDYRIPRGKPVDVPEEVAEVIKNAMAQENAALEFSEANKNVQY